MRKGQLKIFLKNVSLFILLTTSMQVIGATPSVTPEITHYTSTKHTLEKITPEQALKKLIEGNKRFVNNTPIQRNLINQAKVTSLHGQFPSAVILSCMDSRGSPELIFDQGLGDIFSVRVAGNVVDRDQLGGMEYATKVVGSKLIVVMGHANCAAVKGACGNVELGHLTQLMNKIKPAVQLIQNQMTDKLNCDDSHVVDKIAKQNVLDMMKDIEAQSSMIHEMVGNKKIMIVGAMHELQSGKVIFFNENGNELN